MSNHLAHFRADQVVEVGDHVVLYDKNSIEHVIGLIAILKVRAVSINVNYRYVAGELDYLFDNADLVGLIHDRAYAGLVGQVAPKFDRLKTIIAVPNPLEPDDASAVGGYGGVLLEDAMAGQSDARDFGPRRDRKSTRL